jgi:hypothetical protein
LNIGSQANHPKGVFVFIGYLMKHNEL